MRARRLWLGAFFLMSVLCSAALAQENDRPTLRAAVAVVDTDQLFARTKMGQRITSELNERGRALQEENDRLTAALTEEEQALTELRDTMEPDAFRAAAEEFDARVQGIRRSRDAAIAAFDEERRQAPNRFVEQIRNVLGEIMVERGAVALLNQQIVLLSLNAIDITDEAVARIDANLGDGIPRVEAADQ